MPGVSGTASSSVSPPLGCCGGVVSTSGLTGAGGVVVSTCGGLSSIEPSSFIIGACNGPGAVVSIILSDHASINLL